MWNWCLSNVCVCVWHRQGKRIERMLRMEKCFKTACISISITSGSKTNSIMARIWVWTAILDHVWHKKAFMAGVGVIKFRLEGFSVCVLRFVLNKAQGERYSAKKKRASWKLELFSTWLTRKGNCLFVVLQQNQKKECDDRLHCKTLGWRDRERASNVELSTGGCFFLCRDFGLSIAKQSSLDYEVEGTRVSCEVKSSLALIKYLFNSSNTAFALFGLLNQVLVLLVFFRLLSFVCEFHPERHSNWLGWRFSLPFAFPPPSNSLVVMPPPSHRVPHGATHFADFP